MIKLNHVEFENIVIKSSFDHIIGDCNCTNSRVGLYFSKLKHGNKYLQAEYQ